MAFFGQGKSVNFAVGGIMVPIGEIRSEFGEIN